MATQPPPFWPARDPNVPVPVNLFLAILPPLQVRHRIGELAGHLRRVHGLKGNLIRPDHQHCSLHCLGGRDHSSGGTILRLKSVLAGVAFPKFDVVFDHAKSFSVGRERNPFVLAGSDGLNALRQLHRRLGAELVRARLGDRVRSGYEPHVTLLWADRLVEEYPIDPIRWTVDAFVLVLSLVGYTRHIHMERWPLRG